MTIMNYSAQQYVDVLDRLVAAPASPTRDEHIVEVLKVFLSRYRTESLTFLGLNSSSSKR
jgi:hypothetical protein